MFDGGGMMPDPATIIRSDKREKVIEPCYQEMTIFSEILFPRVGTRTYQFHRGKNIYAFPGAAGKAM